MKTLNMEPSNWEDRRKEYHKEHEIKKGTNRKIREKRRGEDEKRNENKNMYTKNKFSLLEEGIVENKAE